MEVNIPGKALICAPNKLFLPPATTLALLLFSMMLCRLPPGNMALYGDKLAGVAAAVGVADRVDRDCFRADMEGLRLDSLGVVPGDNPGDALEGAGLACPCTLTTALSC